MPPTIDIMESLKTQPLGTGQGEGSLQAPFNATTDYVICKVRNLSAVRERREVEEYISWCRGGEKYVARTRQKGQAIPLDLLQSQARFMDISPTKFGIYAIDIVLQFNNRFYKVPAVGTGEENQGAEGEEAPWITVPDGIIDLYYGNPLRLQDPEQKVKELERVQARRRDRCVRDGSDNEWAFVDWSYRVIKPEAHAVDAGLVLSGKLVEI